MMKRNSLKMPVLEMCMVLILALLLGQVPMLNAKAFDLHPTRVVDEADVLADYEEEELLEMVNEISERQDFDVVIAVVESLDGEDIQYYAADFYDYNGYGMGANYDGALFIISMQEREWFVLTTGYGIDVLTDSEIDYVAEDMVPYLSDGDYMSAFELFARFCDKQIQHETGEETSKNDDGLASGESTEDFYEDLMEDEDFYYEEGDYERSGSPGIIVSVLIGLVLAFIPTLVMRGKLKSVHMQSSAGGYEKRETRRLTTQRDVFLYHTVNRVPKPKENHSRSGGGSSTFRGSSGRSHGGRGGGF